MNYSRLLRSWWLLGILLLICSSLGANWALNGALLASIPVSSDTAARSGEAEPQVVTALGFVDVDGGVVSLYPVQQGRIVEVVREGAKVKKNEVLLRLDNRLAQYQLDQANAALLAAKAQRSKAQNAAKQHQNLIEQQKTAEQVAIHKKAVAEQQLKKFLNLNEGTEFDKKIYEENDKLAQENVKAEQLRSKALQLLSDDLKSEIQRAEADVSANEALVNKGKFAVDECSLHAPADGVVLRVTVAAGEVIGANPSQQAVITFCPNTPRIVRAEVLQEWAALVRVGQTACVKDDIHEGEIWIGTVKSISDWIAPKRQKIIEPFMFNDVRTLECLIELPPNAAARIGQRVRVKIDVAYR